MLLGQWGQDWLKEASWVLLFSWHFPCWPWLQGFHLETYTHFLRLSSLVKLPQVPRWSEGPWSPTTCFYSTVPSTSILYSLPGYRAGVGKFFHKGPNRRHFRFCQPYGLCCNYSTWLWEGISHHRQYLNEWVWLCSNKIWWWTLKFGFCIFLICYEIFFFFWFIEDHLKM